MSSPLTDYQLRHLRALIERERTHAGETAAGILLAATLARLQHLERRLAQAEGALADLRTGHGETAAALAASWFACEGQEP